ncbi:hypothetical protein [Dyadobacter pollutisoli]|jgi:hypothetical protein|uniref:Uncharacterized protein n=1 Tax=Dyadobacter pollutisoli TaxID=2910158 RepID=A0A9E8NBH9_9BACT|nr:hypothetical protein [Dyadobacter pollutisoli]WAC11501.1 hypothetical protein ON006_27695 [Dyadobacter pollutisoli]
MEDKELMALWKTYDQKLEENLVLNRRNTEDITRIKIKSLLGSMKPIKIFTIITGILWVVFVDTLIVATFHFASPFFLISAGIQALITKLAIGIYLYQMVLIYQTDISEPLLATQERIARLQSSTIWITRFLFLQFPVWTTFYIGESLLKNGGVIWYVIQSIVTLAFTFVAVWFFVNIKYENRNKNWFRLIFNGKEWDPVMKAMGMLREIEGYR